MKSRQTEAERVQARKDAARKAAREVRRRQAEEYKRKKALRIAKKRQEDRAWDMIEERRRREVKSGTNLEALKRAQREKARLEAIKRVRQEEADRYKRAKIASLLK